MSGLASPEKLRSTCNQCALSKVRCNKRKPTCQRCETHEFECVYDRSRRRGKPRTTQQQRSLDGRSTPFSAQGGAYNWPGSSYNAAIDPFSKLSSLLPGDAAFDCSLWADSGNMFYSDNSDSMREWSSGEMSADKSASTPQEQPQSQAGDSSVVMTFAPLDKPCHGDTCTSTAFCTLGTL